MPAAEGATSPISVIVVNFDTGPLLARCLESALSSLEPVEVVIVDNGSQDESLHDARRRALDDERVRLLETGRNLGFAAAANRGLALARGDLVLLLNPDTVLEPKTLTRMRRALDEHPGAGLAGCLILNPDGSEQAGCRRDTPTPARALVRAFGLGRVVEWAGPRAHALRDFVRTGDPLPEGPVEVDAISGAFMLVRRRALEAVGPLDEGYHLHCEDLDWCHRFRQAGLGVLFVPDARIVHEKGGSSHARPLRVLWHLHWGMVRYYRKFFRHEYPAPVFWAAIAAIAGRFVALAGWTLGREGLRAVSAPVRRRERTPEGAPGRVV